MSEVACTAELGVCGGVQRSSDTGVGRARSRGRPDRADTRPARPRPRRTGPCRGTCRAVCSPPARSPAGHANRVRARANQRRRDRPAGRILTTEPNHPAGDMARLHCLEQRRACRPGYMSRLAVRLVDDERQRLRPRRPRSVPLPLGGSRSVPVPAVGRQKGWPRTLRFGSSRLRRSLLEPLSVGNPGLCAARPTTAEINKRRVRHLLRARSADQEPLVADVGLGYEEVTPGGSTRPPRPGNI
jgi:hypothetical protein